MTSKSKIKKGAAKVIKADAAVAKEFQQQRDSWPIGLLGTLSDVGDQPQLRLISGATFLAGLVSRNPRLMRTGIRMLVAHELATAAKNFVKLRVDRLRPRSADTPEKAKPREGRHTDKEITSFPSGHTAGSVAVARAFAREFPDFQNPALAAAGAVAAAQIPRCAHYPTDVGVGAFIGAGTEALLGKVWPANPQEEYGSDSGGLARRALPSLPEGDEVAVRRQH